MWPTEIFRVPCEVIFWESKFYPPQYKIQVKRRSPITMCSIKLNGMIENVFCNFTNSRNRSDIDETIE